jgi:Sec-independent protein translocase protein TatA
MFGHMCDADGVQLLLLILVVMLAVGRGLPELIKGLSQGIREFRKATREVTDELLDQQHWEDDGPTPPLPMLAAFILGTVCLLLVAYEIGR